jgi:hypothetical protein
MYVIRGKPPCNFSELSKTDADTLECQAWRLYFLSYTVELPFYNNDHSKAEGIILIFDTLSTSIRHRLRFESCLSKEYFKARSFYCCAMSELSIVFQRYIRLLYAELSLYDYIEVRFINVSVTSG